MKLLLFNTELLPIYGIQAYIDLSNQKKKNNKPNSDTKHHNTWNKYEKNRTFKKQYPSGNEATIAH